MSSVKFGFALPIFAFPGPSMFRTPCYERLDVRRTLDAAIEVERLSYDSIWVADHLFHGRDGEIMECWTTLSVLAGATRRPQLGPIRLNNALRQPALVAKMASTLDRISNGRLIFFPDIGWRKTESIAYGMCFPSDDEVRAARMREALELTRRLWTDSGPTTYDGCYYQLAGAYCSPKPVQRPHPPIWIGESVRPGPNHILLDIAVEYADTWAYVPTSTTELKAKLAALEKACARRGRDHEGLTKAMTTQLLIGATWEEVQSTLQHVQELRASTDRYGLHHGDTRVPEQAFDTYIIGTPEDVTDKLREYVGLGITHFILWFIDFPSLGGLRLFAEKVMPSFR